MQNFTLGFAGSLFNRLSFQNVGKKRGKAGNGRAGEINLEHAHLLLGPALFPAAPPAALETRLNAAGLGGAWAPVLAAQHGVCRVTNETLEQAVKVYKKAQK